MENEKVIESAENISHDISNIEGYIRHFDEVLKAQHEDIKQLLVTIEGMTELSAASKKAIEDVSAIREHLDLSSEVVTTTLPDLKTAAQNNSNRIDILNQKNFGTFKWVIGSIFVTTIFSLMWTSLSLQDRQVFARNFLTPVATIGGVTGLGWVLGKDLLSQTNNDNEDNENDIESNDRHNAR